MALNISISLLLLITICLAQQIYNGPRVQLSPTNYGDAVLPDVKNLNDLAHAFYDKMCRDAGRSPGCYKYVDIEGKQDSNWPQRRVDVISVDNLQYSVIQTVDQPSLILSQDYCNSLSADGSFRFSKGAETSSTCSWSVTSGISSTTSIEISESIPALGGTKFTESINLSLSSTTSQSTSHKDTWSIDATVPAPAHTYVNATYAVIEHDYSASWTANILIRGCANVWFNDKINDHWEWWYGIDNVYGGVPGFSCWYQDPPAGQDECLGCYCTYEATGTYYGIGGATAHLSTNSATCSAERVSDFLKKIYQ